MGEKIESHLVPKKITERSKAVPKDLLDKVKILYGSMDAAAFELSQRADSEHNRRTFNAMKKELAVQGYTSSIAHRAVRRHFETLKRAHRDTNAQGEELDRVNQSRQKKKKASRSHRVAVVRPGEKALWEGLSVYYMTDESDNGDDGTIVKHKLPWRSVMLDAFMETLDKRHESTRGVCWVEGKKRVLGSPSKRPPPEECPSNFVTNVVEDREEEERCISEEDFDPTNWSS
ncbi:hypothetical protein EMCRGX_G015602 [Ephydatia muelleri]